jgi:hypothetical protein
MNVSSLLSFTGALASGVLALVVLFRGPRSIAHRCFAAGMGVLCVEAVFVGLSLCATHSGQMLYWQESRLQTHAFLPSAWLLFSLCYARGNYRDFLRRWWPVVVGVLIVPVGAAFGFSHDLITGLIETKADRDWLVVLGWPGLTVNLVFLVSMVLVLINLEATFRAAVGTMRWQIKFMVLGLAALFVVRIFSTSQALLYTGSRLSLQVVNAVMHERMQRPEGKQQPVELELEQLLDH